MNDAAHDPFAAIEASLEQEKKDYWNELIAANDPDAVTKHDALCAEVDKIIRGMREASAAIDAQFELARQAMINTAIAHHQGDDAEVALVLDEYHDQSSGTPGDV